MAPIKAVARGLKFDFFAKLLIILILHCTQWEISTIIWKGVYLDRNQVKFSISAVSASIYATVVTLLVISLTRPQLFKAILRLLSTYRRKEERVKFPRHLFTGLLLSQANLTFQYCPGGSRLALRHSWHDHDDYVALEHALSSPFQGQGQTRVMCFGLLCCSTSAGTSFSERFMTKLSKSH